jgi:hypothetical protein
MNNPIRFIDPDGMASASNGFDSWMQTSSYDFYDYSHEDQYNAEQTQTNTQQKPDNYVEKPTTVNSKPPSPTKVYDELKKAATQQQNEEAHNENTSVGGDNVQKAGFEGGEHLIGPTLILLGKPINLLKPIGALGSKSGSSIVSYTLSKLLPFRSPLIKRATTSIFGLESSTAVLGRALGRLTPFIGWGMTIWDVSYNLAPLAVDKLILPLYPTSIIEENKKEAGHWAEVSVCFRVGTLVYSTNGFIPIEKIMVGDTVLSYNLEKSTIEPNKVEKVFKRETQEIYELNTSNQKLFVTAQHPFYVEGKGWIKVKDLQKGDMLKTKNDLNEQILNIGILKQTEIVYNIEVEGNHNYFVTNNTILVHNK